MNKEFCRLFGKVRCLLMAGYFLLLLTIIGLIVAVKIAVNDYSENGKLTKASITKLLILLAIVFFSIVIVVYFSPDSWM